MTTGNLTTYPAAVQAQLDAAGELVTALLGQNLHGVYLTGDGFTGPSVAEVSTLRVLIVTARDLLRDTRLGLAQTFLRYSLQPAALEVLVVRVADLASAHASLLVQLQFSEALRPQLERETTGHTWLQWPDGPTGAVDRAAVLARLQSGTVALSGSPVAALVPPTPAEDPAAREPSTPREAGASQPPGGQQLTFDP